MIIIGSDWNSIARIENSDGAYDFTKVDLPETQKQNGLMLRLPHFATASQGFLDQYINTFKKIISHADQISKSLSL